MSNPSDQFIEIYNRLDGLLRARFDADAKTSHAKLIDRASEGDPTVQAMKSRLHACRALRNAIVHMSKNSEEPIATPLGSVIDDYARMVDYIQTPPTALESVAIHGDDLYTRNWSDNLLDSLQHMQKHSFLGRILVSKMIEDHIPC